MSRQRLVLGIGLLVSAFLWFALTAGNSRLQGPFPELRTIALDPYQEPVLAGYARYRDALLTGDLPTLKAMADEAEGYLQLRVLFTLGRYEGLDPAERVGYLERAMALRIPDALAKLDTRELWLEVARTAREAGLYERAVAAYRLALPDEDAAEELAEIVTDAYDLANYYLQDRMYEEALEALDGRAAPSIEAPAYRGVNEYEKALDAYDRWLAEVPNSQEARLGRGWMLYYLGYFEQADAAFAGLGASSAYYGRGLIARRQGDLDRAIDFYRRSGNPLYMWYATDLLEERGRARDAIPIYLDLAKTDSSYYADDSAYRALVLAERYGLPEVAAQAKALLPADSYLGLVAGKDFVVPQTSTLPNANPPVLELARALAAVHDLEAAVGELEFALQDAHDEATTVAIAEALQAMGEFRQSQQAAEAWVRAGSLDLRTWRLTYPRAYPGLVADAAATWDVTPFLIWSVMRQESRFYPEALSVAGAKGLMQFMPATWEWVAEEFGEPPGDPFEPEDSIRYGAYYLRWLLDYLGGDMERAIPAYNGGPGYIKRLYSGPVVDGDKTEFYRFIDKHETRDYLQKVMFNYRVYRALYPEQLADRP